MNDLFTTLPAPPAPPAPPANEPMSISELSSRLKATVEQNFIDVRVQGEISGFKKAASGHCYMQLKDDSSALKAIIWKGVASTISLELADGLEIIAVGRLTTYPARSEYQLVISHLESSGMGTLLQQVENRRRKLEAEGLFAMERKKPLPLYPQVLGVITSPTGAVIEDIKNRLDLRMPVRLLLYPVTVQGDKATSQICRALFDFNDATACAKLGIPSPDVIIIARGGGSIEDLMPFNDEDMVRAVAMSKIPIISAIGHETDTSLVDFAADVRAPTPTAAAELVVKLKSQMIEDINAYFFSMQKSMKGVLEIFTTKILGLQRELTHPARKLLDLRRQKLDDAAEHLQKNIKNKHSDYTYRLANVSARLRSPQQIWQDKNKHYNEALKQKTMRLEKSMQNFLDKKNTQIQKAQALLENSDYNKTMKRGFAIISTKTQGKWIAQASSQNLKAKEEIKITFHDGKRQALIKE